jgi:TonB family protein
MAVLLALPVAVALSPKWGLPATAPSPRTALATPAAKTAVTAPVNSPAVPAPAKPSSLPVGWLYITGAAVVAARFLAGFARMRRLVSCADEATHAAGLVDSLRGALGIGRRVRALESPDAPVPMAWGMLRPVTVLPEAARDWPAARLHSALLHELVHVQRHDLVAQTLAQAACCLYWFHPLAWLAARELRKERERACDDAVLGRGVAAPEYAGHLMEMVRAMAARRGSMVDAPAMAETSDLESRVRALLDRRRNRAPLTRRAALAVAAMVCALVIPIATWTAHAQSDKGALAGIITDPTGARIPGCAVSIRNLDGSNQELTRVNPAGEYQFAAIPPGRYVVEVRAAGFKLATTEIVVTAGTAARADVAMTIGSMSETVTVRGSRPANAPAPAQSMARAAGTPQGSPQRIPIGGNVQAARLISQVKPVYPDDLKVQGITGTVMIQMIISATGEPLNPQVLNTTVDPRLAQAAMDAVSQWRYSPALLNGQPVEVPTKVDVTFELDDSPQGNAQAPGSTSPVLLLKVEPQYTEEARKAKYQGTVVLHLDVDETGTPANIRVLRSLGLGLDEAAIEAVKKWKFRPATQNGAPIRMGVNVEVPFRLM